MNTSKERATNFPIPAGMGRREFITTLSLATLGVAGMEAFGGGAAECSIELGVCQPIAQAPVVKKAGFTYIEESVSRVLMPSAPEADFERRFAELQAAVLPVRACNGFIPGDMKMVGPEVKMEPLLKFVETACRRAKKVGIERIVFGSGGARRIPDGFDRAKAREQFIEFGKRIGPIAGDNGVIIVLEALNRGETNFINRVDEGLEIIDSIGHPSFQMHADFYHMLKEEEGPESIIKGGRKIKHCHVAEKQTRSAPGVAGDDFRPYLKALKTIGYKGGLSIESGWKNFQAEVQKAGEVLRQQLATA